MTDTESAEVRYTVGVNIIDYYCASIAGPRGEQRCRGEAHKIG